MKISLKKILASFLAVTAFMIMLFLTAGANCLPVKAEETASQVTVGSIDYDSLTIKVYKKGNTIVYFSSDSRKTWDEVEGDSNSDGNGAYILMDISWVSSKSDTTIYFKGNKETTALEVEFPKTETGFKVTFDKINIDFQFENYGDANGFLWRKSTDYNWVSVPFDQSSEAYKSFLSQINDLRFKGCKIVFVCDQVLGTDAEHPGQRPSKEVKISIPKMANAPSIKINIKKMTLGTKENMEYFDVSKNAWVSCEKNMAIEDIAPLAMYSGSKEGSTVQIKIRNAASEKKAFSKTCIVTIPGQTKAPEFGSNGSVKTEYSEGKLLLTFEKASTTSPIEYCVVKNGDTFDVSKAKWKTVKSAKEVKVEKKKYPDGSKVYIRYAGVKENASKNISLKLPSYYASYTITWPAETAKT